MSRKEALLAALTAEPTTTSDLYDRIGYRTLVRVGLVPYHEFREELTTLAGQGIIESDLGEDGATVWRLPATDGGASG